MRPINAMLDKDGSSLWFRQLKELESGDMLVKRICLYCDGKSESDHNCIFKWLAVLLVDKDGFHDNVILIVSDKK